MKCSTCTFNQDRFQPGVIILSDFIATSIRADEVSTSRLMYECEWLRLCWGNDVIINTHLLEKSRAITVNWKPAEQNQDWYEHALPPSSEESKTKRQMTTV